MSHVVEAPQSDADHSGRFTYGTRVEAAGVSWEVCDVRSIDATTVAREIRGRLRPIDAVSGERLTSVRIGRAQREMVYVDLTVYPDGEISAYAAARTYSTPLTDRQRQLSLEDLARVEFYLPPLNAQQRLDRFISTIAADAGRAGARTISSALRRTLEAHLRELPSHEEADRHRVAILEQACADFRARLHSLLTHT